jgi:hypothetical protein
MVTRRQETFEGVAISNGPGRLTIDPQTDDYVIAQIRIALDDQTRGRLAWRCGVRGPWIRPHCLTSDKRTKA